MSKRNRHGGAPYASLAKKLEEIGVPKTREITIHEDGVTDKSTTEIVIRPFPIMIGVPMDETLFSTFLMLFMRNVHPMPWDAFSSTQSTYLPDARNIVHEAFLRDTKCSHLLMLDSDVLCPANVVERLLAHQKPIVSGYYMTKALVGKSNPVVYNYLGEDEKGISNWGQRKEIGTGLEKVDAVGMGCVLMSREVAEALGHEPYNMNNGGEDVGICRKLMLKGIDLYVDWSIDCAHLGLRWY